VSQHNAPRTPSSILRPLAIALAVTAAVIGALAQQSASSSAFSTGHVDPPARHEVRLAAASSSAPPPGEVPPASGRRTATGGDRAITEDDGDLPDGVTAFDVEYPGIANLDPVLLQALQQAAGDAAEDGIQLSVNSGWRSRRYQDALFRAAVARYGSAREAARWVATANTSAHVSGDAVDVGPSDAAAWLSAHGVRYGLCQTYRNEAWHYEHAPQDVDRGCPAMYADSAHDPRTHR
jgi:zinc D-Ala-D-Ala carboxypeptidase